MRGKRNDHVCEVCGAEDPRWLRWHDQSIGDFFMRTERGFPGPTSRGVRFCEDPACVREVEARYGPQGNQAAFNRLVDELGAKGLDADDNEVRLAALCAEKWGL